VTGALRIAAIQSSPQLGDVDANLAAIEAWSRQAANRGARLVLLPECALQGIVFHSAEDALAVAVPRTDPVFERLGSLTEELGLGLVFGFLERLETGYSNTAAILLPGDSPRFYRKTHLTELGADRWAEPGDSLCEVMEYEGLRFGVLVCYDVRFPEASRVLALAGADALLLATNSPAGYEGTYDHAARTRAWENRVWFVVANRVGIEDDAAFIGRSLAVDPFGGVVGQLDGYREGMLVVDIELEAARSKLLPGHEGAGYSFLAARRPELYGALGDPERGPSSAPRELSV